MTANAGYHAYATGDVLTAAQVQYNLQNQTVMYFATTTARDTALSGKLVDGMCAYTPATGVLVYNGTAWVGVGTASPLTTKGDIWGYSTTNARVPVGTNGQVLLADSTNANGVAWGTPAAGSLTLLTTTNLSGTSTTVSSISQSYKNLQIVIQNATTNANGLFWCNPNGNYVNGSGVRNGAVSGLSGNPIYFGNFTTGSNYNNSVIYFTDYANSNAPISFVAYGSDSVTTNSWSYGGGTYSAPITSFVFTNQNGTFTGGTIRIYGVN